MPRTDVRTLRGRRALHGDRYPHRLQMLLEYDRKYLELMGLTGKATKSEATESAIDIAVYVLKNHPEIAERVSDGRD